MCDKFIIVYLIVDVGGEASPDSCGAGGTVNIHGKVTNALGLAIKVHTLYRC